MKKFLMILFCLLLTTAMLFGGCAAPTVTTSQSSTPSTTAISTDPSTSGTTLAAGMVDTTKFKKDGPYKVGFSNISIVNTWRVQLVHEIESAAIREGVELFITDAGGDDVKQVSDIQDLLAKGIDLLIVSPGSMTAVANVTGQAIKDGVPVVTAAQKIEGADNYTAFVGTNEVEFGYAGAKWLMEQLGGKGNIICLNGIAGTSISLERIQGFEKAVAESGQNIKILNSYDADWAYDKGKRAVEQALAAYPQIDGIWSQGGAMTQGAVEAFQAAGRPLVPMSAEDNNGFLKLWAKLIPEGFKAIAPSEPTWLSAEALSVGLKILKGEPVLKDYYVPVPVIVPETVSQYARPELSDAFWCNSKLSDAEQQKWYGETAK